MRLTLTTTPTPKRNTLAVALVAAAAASATATAQATGDDAFPPVTGVAPQDYHKYAEPADGQSWKCLESGESIPWSSINDDYCDCKDGSDEPGTSACPNARFYCHNDGHIPAYIRSSRVNDGVCDVECCDGSDERDGKVACPNTCAKVGREYRKAKAEQENVRRAGSKIRERYIVEARRAAQKLEAEVAKLEVEVQVAEEREKRSKSALELAEKADSANTAKKTATPLYATLRSHQSALAALQERNAALTAELQRLTALLDDLSSGYNPNYQDMAVKGVVMDYRKWRRGANEAPAPDDEEANVKDDEPVMLSELMSQGEWNEEKVTELINADPLLVMQDGSTEYKGHEQDTGILFRIHEYLPDPVLPYFEAAVDTLLDLLMKANVISDVKRASRKADEAETENVLAARAAHLDAESKHRTLSGTLKLKREELDAQPERWGRAGEWKALKGKCVEKNMGEYTYEFCFFGGTLQKPNKGGAQVGLGNFNRFDPINKTLTLNDDGFYLRQLYDNGARCWNGPARSSIVDFTCATENALLDVFEAEKCIYAMKVSTPAVCLPLEGEAEAAAASAGAEKAKVAQAHHEL